MSKGTDTKVTQRVRYVAKVEAKRFVQFKPSTGKN